MSVSTPLGRYSAVGDLKAGEVAIYDDKRHEKTGLAFGLHPTEKSQEIKSNVVAYCFDLRHDALIFIEPADWKIPAWVVPATVSAHVDVQSRSSGYVFDPPETWGSLCLDEEGRLLLPIYNHKVGAGRIAGWLDIRECRYVANYSMNEQKFQIFDSWELRLKDTIRPPNYLE